MNHTEKIFTYWKKPYAPWVVLGCIFLQIWSLYVRIQDFQDVSRPEISGALFTLEEWEGYATSQHFGFAISAFVIVLFSGCLLIGAVARSQKEVDLYSGILYAVMSVCLVILAVLLPVFSQTGMALLWTLLLAVSLGGIVYTVYQVIKTTKEPFV